MKALVKNIALPATQLPPTREYHEEFKIPESWEAQRAAKKRIAEAKRKKHTRKGFHAWTDEERKELIEARAAGRSWDDLAEEYGVSKGAVQVQARRGRAKGYGEYQLYVRNKNKRSSNQSKG